MPFTLTPQNKILMYKLKKHIYKKNHKTLVNEIKKKGRDQNLFHVHT